MRAGKQRDLIGVLLGWMFLFAATGCSVNLSPPVVADAAQADLIANQASVQILRGENEVMELQPGAPVSVQVDDRVQLNDAGRSLMEFRDRMQVEMFRTTEMHLVDAEQEESGATRIRLFQSVGNAHIRLADGAPVLLTLETEYATVTTLEAGTNFIICHKPGGITCGVVYEGAVEVTAQGDRKIAREGEAIYIKPDMPPSEPICMREAEVNQWLSEMHGSGEVQGLGQLVASWPQLSCAEIAQSTPTPAAPALPSAEGMVKIAAGQYWIGSPTPDEFHIPEQEIPLAEFWIDQYEATNAQYQQFVTATGHVPPAVMGADDHPVKGVTWEDAAAYCAWANKRLPTEVEWEAAARGPGPSAPLFPWGSDPTGEGRVMQLPRTETYAVGSAVFNQSPFGVFDMAGNVWEWVGTPYDPVAGSGKVLRGGRHGLIKDMAYRQVTEPDNERFVPFAGFRCAADQAAGG